MVGVGAGARGELPMVLDHQAAGAPTCMAGVLVVELRVVEAVLGLHALAHLVRRVETSAVAAVVFASLPLLRNVSIFVS